jgi:lipopolysaccharide transport system ATP-binding protein
MTYVIQFHNVSKQYRLGMTRTSIPTMLYEFARNILRREQQNEVAKSQFHWALQNVSFDLEPGKSLALVGPNGAGKTTVLKLLAMITKPTSGEINVNGKLSALIELGAGFHPDLSGRENIYLNGAILGLKKSEIRNLFDEIVAFSELEQFIDTPVKRYSSGMAVRLGFAVASSIRPDILLVDEVLAVGDTSFRMKCVQRIRKLLQDGTSLIFVSHNTGLVKAMCEKSLYIENGQAVYYGDTEEALERYNQSINDRRRQQIKSHGPSEASPLGHLEITDVKLRGPDKVSGDGLKTNCPATIIINYIAFEEIQDANIVLRINRTDGVRCIVMYSDQDSMHFSIKKGSGTISAVLEPLQLFPGTYYAVATIKSHDKVITYSMGKSNWFEVKGNLRGHEDNDAVFEPNRNWAHHLFEEKN